MQGANPSSSSSRKRRANRGMLQLLAPISAWSVLLIIVPIAMLVVYSFWTVRDGFIVREFTLGNYVRLAVNYVYPALLWRSILIASGASILTLVLGYPLALYISRRRGRVKSVMYMFVVIPLLTSYIVRIYAMRLVLGSEGIINSLLIYAGVIREPLEFLLFSNFAIFITLCVILSPFMIMPIFTSLEKIPTSFLEASRDLGASDFTTFWRISFPLSLPGVVAGVMFIFVLSIGDFLTPVLVGGTQGMTISKAIQVSFGFAYDWPLGSALSVILLSISLIIIMVSSKFGALREI